MEQNNQQTSLYEKMGGTYTLGADGLCYPDVAINEVKPVYGKYGMLRRIYLKNCKKAVYSTYLLEGRLEEHLNLVDKEANEKMMILVKQLCEQYEVTEELKRVNQLQWIQTMNNVNQMAEEIVLNDLVYV